MVSTMLQLKISKTRKRLYDESWLYKISIIIVIGVMIITPYVLRSTFISSSYGLIESEIPVVPVSFQDPDPTAFHESPKTTVKDSTPVVILTKNEFFFGDLSSFSTDFANVRNKFFIKHIDGAPNVAALNLSIGKWLYSRAQDEKSNSEGIIILLPDQDVPSPVVIQTMAGLKKSPFFEQVILASGII